MSSNTSMYACPKCGSSNIQTERRIDGFHHCMDCRHSWKIGESPPTLFDRITASPEVLAPNLVYSLEFVFRDDWGNEEIKTKWFSTVCDNMAFCDESEAIDATVARLKEVGDE